MPVQIESRTLDELLAASAAPASFQKAVRALASGKPQEQITFNAGAPPVKVLRFVMKLIESYPGVPFESVALEGQAGCSDFSGHAQALPGPIDVDFVWDCKWRAEQLDWSDAYGEPDQIRAAREFGYQCFKKFETQDPTK